jgi:hypothetical protein
MDGVCTVLSLYVALGELIDADSTWTRMNFADLLQPAPLSIALLGSLCVLASSTQDFSLVVKPVEGYPASKIEWKVVKHPHSFKTCLQQLIQAGTTGETQGACRGHL